jgi:class 3 adenylate cyclase/tetratricopeptide (TPR) repeat protein
VILCPNCGHENREGARFCDSCGATLGAKTSTPREERKVVTVLFADLVGFTSRAERLDPEDVRALLGAYHRRVRTDLERFGGTVEKFIGDAVMALYGAPVAHEDDPERAVRSALAIRDWINEQESDLQVRIGVNTGEALITLEARPAEGEGMAAGDVVNTAQRIQAAAPVNGILVGEITYRATRHAIEYREAGPAHGKGKAEPIPVWEAVQPFARFGFGMVQRPQTELVGRERELEALKNAMARVRQERSAQLVTLVGVPGIGKSRMVTELFGHLEQGPELTYWRQGRSLPYGEGVTFWALGEMVKAQAGVLETDSAEQTEEKLTHAVGTLFGDQTEAPWVQGHLRPLVGLSAETSLGGDRRAESFAAWRRFFEALAETRALVMLFEDLHWAGDEVLDFVDYLAEWASGVPILIVATARPELLERRPGWGGGKRNAVTLSLSPLSDEDTARLVGALRGSPVLEAEQQAALIERAGGNPLYAEQFVALLQERGTDARLPENVQGIIAARLDLLTPEEKALLQDAAALGKVFWLGGITAIGDAERWEAEERLHSLERKDFVQPVRRSSVAGESEYAFRHVLVRDVAYGQIPRAARAEKHRLAAQWIESLGRSEDHSEMVAHHYLSALELARAADQGTEGLTEPARAALAEAGERAFALNAYGASGRFFHAALELWPLGSVERGRLLFEAGRARFYLNESVTDLLEQALAILVAGGERETAAEAALLVCESIVRLGDRDRAYGYLHQAQALVQDVPLSRAKVDVACNVSRYHMLAGEDEEAVASGREAFRMAEELGLNDLMAHALDNIGASRVSLGDVAGIEDIRRGAAIAAEANASYELCRAYNNLGALLTTLGDLEEGWEAQGECGRVAERFGQGIWTRWLIAADVSTAYWQGEWSESIRVGDRFILDAEASSHYETPQVLAFRARMKMAGNQVEEATRDAEKALQLSRATKDRQSLSTVLGFGSFTLLEAGKADEAGELAGEFLAALRSRGLGSEAVSLPTLAWTLVALGRTDGLVDAFAAKSHSRWAQAAQAVIEGNFRRAADVCQEMGSKPDEAYARLRAAEALLADGLPDEAEGQLERAVSFYRSVGATRYLQQAEALVAADVSRTGTEPT